VYLVLLFYKPSCAEVDSNSYIDIKMHVHTIHFEQTNADFLF